MEAPGILALIAPIAPFRGGIARHSQALAAAIKRETGREVRVTSFSRLYPALLYPGNSDKDPDAQVPSGLTVDCTLDTVNPLTWRRTVRNLLLAEPAVVLIPAWTFFVAPALGWIARRLRRAGIPVLMVVHNVADHDTEGWKERLLGWQLAAANGFVTHSTELATALRRAGHRQPIEVSPHPAYSDYPEARHTLPREFGLELLCFGLVRRYKGIDIALRALASAGLGDVRLTIAGEQWEDRAEIAALRDRPELQGKVEIIDRYVSDTEAAELFDRCDAVLAPYRSVTGSGVAALARHYRRPVIAPDLAGFSECIEHGRTGWLFPIGDETVLSELLRSTVNRASSAAMYASLELAASEDGWQNYAKTVLDLADKLSRPERRAA